MVIFGSKKNSLVTNCFINIRLLISGIVIFLFFCFLSSCNSSRTDKQAFGSAAEQDQEGSVQVKEDTRSVYSLLVLPGNPVADKPFRIVAAGNRHIRKAKIIVNGPGGNLAATGRSAGREMPGFVISDFPGAPEGKYRVALFLGDSQVCSLEFIISDAKKEIRSIKVWDTTRGWDSGMEDLYSIWLTSLFRGCDEKASWTALHEVTQSRERNFLYNCLSLGEDDPDGKVKVMMQPDCADNPFFLRAYFSWKLGLPFGFHISDRGSLNRSPGTGQWITNEIAASRAGRVEAFNSFLRRVMDGVHSGTARTALDNENSDYYPVSLDRNSLRPGTVYADPYGHTLVIVGWVPQSGNSTGLLLAVDAQPDGTVGIKRFWKGNFLFSTSGVVGEPGFKAFRPISLQNGKIQLLKNSMLASSGGFIPYSLQQRKMKSELFYHTMERLINPDPPDPGSELHNLIQALHEQLLVRVTSVANGETYMRSHPGTVISMPSGAAGIFQAGGQWEAFSTPNRDLRLLIAMDEVLGFPAKVADSPDDYKISKLDSPERLRKRLQENLEREVSELSITYTRTDGSQQPLTVAELLNRREAFEMAYNPNDGIEIRWGAPQKSVERSSCRRQSPAYQTEIMLRVRRWFKERAHPPT